MLCEKQSFDLINYKKSCVIFCTTKGNAFREGRQKRIDIVNSA